MDSTLPARRSGFSLIETIATTGLLAVIASFVVPTVVQR
jgi:prepilin-type N-terminal cleavage/methylation domain-containing protein